MPRQVNVFLKKQNIVNGVEKVSARRLNKTTASNETGETLSPVFPFNWHFGWQVQRQVHLQLK